MELCLYTLFEKSGRPRCVGIKLGDKVVLYDLYRPGGNKSIDKIRKTIDKIREIVIIARKNGYKIITTDFKSQIKAFKIPIIFDQYNVYDLHLPKITPTNNQAKDNKIVRQVIEKLSLVKTKEYQKILANAVVVYQDLENSGLLFNFNHVYPHWSVDTFTGRSKTTNFNIQGFHEHEHVRAVDSSYDDVLVHFDWICADIRAAAILSGDDKLAATFVDSDPYTAMMNEINCGSDDVISRDECKLYMLKSINSMDIDSVVFTDIYRKLGKWILRCKHSLNNGTRWLDTILGRRFRLNYAKNELAVLNGAMQGSVAHGMQLVVRRVWEKFPNKIICDIHDSLVMSSSSNSGLLRSLINTVSNIMVQPFVGVLDFNPRFPLKISIGKKWKQWKYLRTVRDVEEQVACN